MILLLVYFLLYLCVKTRIEGIRITGYPESPVFHILRSNPVSPEADQRFIKSIVNKVSLVCQNLYKVLFLISFQSVEGGICFTIASRLHQNEAICNWPVSIRVAVTIEMSQSDLDSAVEVLEKAVKSALNEANL